MAFRTVERNRYSMCQDLKQLTPVDLRKVWGTEAQHFTPWLAQEKNLTLLGETLGMELELEARERNVGGFRADLLCKNTVDDSWVLIENQLETTDHTHVGQLLTYAAGLDASTVIWIAKTFQDEHYAMLDWLNKITDERYGFFGIEMKVWQIEDSARAAQFEVVLSPNDWISGVSRDTQRRELSNAEQQWLQFWAGLGEYIADRGSPVNFGSPGPRNFHRFSIGRTEFSLMAWLLRSRIGIRLIMQGQNAQAHFHLLEEQQEEIHNEFGKTLEWNELSNHQSCRVSLYKEDTNPADENDWPHQYEWFTTKLELFDRVFRERIRGIDAADWIPEDDAP